MVHERRPGSEQPPRRVDDHDRARRALGGPQPDRHVRPHPTRQVRHPAAEQRRADHVERQLGHSAAHAQLDPIGSVVQSLEERLDRIDHQVAHPDQVALGEHWVQQHPVTAPGLALVGEQAQPDNRPQQLVLDRFAIPVAGLVQHVVHVVGMPEHERLPPREARADDVVAREARDQRVLDREAVAQRRAHHPQATETRSATRCRGRTHATGAAGAGYGRSRKNSPSARPSGVAGSSPSSHSRATSSHRPFA